MKTNISRSERLILVVVIYFLSFTFLIIFPISKITFTVTAFPAILYSLLSDSPVAFALSNCSSVKPCNLQHSLGVSFLILPIWISPFGSTKATANFSSSVKSVLSTKTPECSAFRLLIPESCLAVMPLAISVSFGSGFRSMK